MFTVQFISQRGEVSDEVHTVGIPSERSMNIRARMIGADYCAKIRVLTASTGKVAREFPADHS